MANTTVKDAKSIKGTNPQFLVDKIVRLRIYESQYWKEECFALTAELLVDKAMELRYIAGTYAGNIKPTPFLCLALKMLQIQPSRDIVIEFIKNEKFKYVRALGAFYLRLTGTAVDCYKYLEPLLNDYRKIRLRDRDGNFVLSHMDEFIDDLLTLDRYADTALPRIQKRSVLESNSKLEPRISVLMADGEFNELLREEEAASAAAAAAAAAAASTTTATENGHSTDRGHRSEDRHHRSRHRGSSDEDDDGSRRHKSRKHRHRSRSRSPKRDRKHKSTSSSHKKSRHADRSDDEERSHKSRDGNLSVDETNKLRASLGLPPLK